MSTEIPNDVHPHTAHEASHELYSVVTEVCTLFDYLVGVFADVS